jgi:hypothetical protein
MSAMQIFISYSSHNRAAVKSLAADLGSLGHSVWFDQELQGGQVWWDTILRRIRDCDAFVLALTNDVLNSRPCKLEYSYAYEVDRPIIPVLLASDVNITLLPVILQERQLVNYINQDKAALLALNTALTSLPPTPPLPDPLPRAPEIPVSPLVEMAEQIQQPDLSHDQQVFLFHQLKNYAENPDFTHDALALLEQLEQHPSLLAAVFRDINAYLSTAVPQRTPQAAPVNEPTPTESTAPPSKPVTPPPAGLAQIVIRRLSELSGMFREYQIFIDDQKVGSVRNNQDVAFDVTPGRHSVQVRLDWVKSKPQQITLAADQTVVLHCRWQLGVLGGKLLLEPDRSQES